MQKLVTFSNGINLDNIRAVIDSLETLTNEFEIIDDRITNFEVGVIINHKFNLHKEFETNLYDLLIYNIVDMNGKQYNKLQQFIQNTKDILSSNEKILKDNIKNISIMIVFNQEFKNLKLKGVKMDTKKVQNEDIEFNFIPTKPKYSLNQVVMNDELKKEIEKTLTIIHNRELIYHDWGFSEIEPSPKAILNFYGPSGTGKTMTAHAIAKELDKKIMALNYSDIESKYVGDAPKNLVKAFEIAKKEEAVLFFDEADSFLGKRISDISSSSDQAINSLRSQLLILLDEFEGVVIFATNLIKNYDKAFESRILKHLKFDLPDNRQREKIIQNYIPQKVPFKDNKRLSKDDIKELSKLSEGFSGRYIKNAILDSLTNAVLSKREYVIFEDFKKSFIKISQSIKDINIDDNTKDRLKFKISKELNKKRRYFERKIKKKSN